MRGNAKPICRSCRGDDKKEYHKQYRKDNKAAILTRNKVYKMRRRHNDPGFRLANNCSRMINIALNGKKENYSIWKFLPYTMGDLTRHLENQFDENMNWDNYGSYWHLDHIIPQSIFSYTTMTDDAFLKCWALDNLQPLEAKQNIRKSNRLIHEVK
jgi:5-methylcytosine-specific restriction endonuclease McrA